MVYLSNAASKNADKLGIDENGFSAIPASRASSWNTSVNAC